MKSFIVLLRKGNIITRHSVAARTPEDAGTIAVNRFGGIMTKKVRQSENGCSIKWNSYCSLHGPWTPEVVEAYNVH